MGLRPKWVQDPFHFFQVVPALIFAVLNNILKDLQTKLAQFKVTRYQISRRILRMNKSLEKEFGENIAEKRGWHWALTSFALEVWSETEKALKFNSKNKRYQRPICALPVS
jgi:hypothetical protein